MTTRKTLSAQELNTLAGRRLSRDERRDWRNRMDAEWGITTNRDPGPANPFRQALEQYSPTSMNPNERRRYESLKAKADARDLEIASEAQNNLTRLRMQEDSDVQAAVEHFRQDIETIEVDSPEGLKLRAAATSAMQDVLGGDKSKLRDYYRLADTLIEQKIADSNAALEQTRREASEMRSREAAREAENARLHAKAAQSRLNQNNIELPSD